MSVGEILSLAIGKFVGVMYFLILVRCILSWFPINPANTLVRLLYALTEPLLGPIRNLLRNSPLGGGMMLDFSPIIALFVLQIVATLIQSLVIMLPF